MFSLFRVVGFTHPTIPTDTLIVWSNEKSQNHALDRIRPGPPSVLRASGPSGVSGRPWLPSTKCNGRRLAAPVTKAVDTIYGSARYDTPPDSSQLEVNRCRNVIALISGRQIQFLESLIGQTGPQLPAWPGWGGRSCKKGRRSAILLTIVGRPRCHRSGCGRYAPGCRFSR